MSALGREFHDGWFDGDGDGRADFEFAEVVRSLSKAVAAFRVDPIDDHDHECHGVGCYGLTRRDGVLATLHGGDNADNLVEGRMSGSKFKEDISIGDCVDFGASLEFLSPFWDTKYAKFLLFIIIICKVGKSLVKAFWWAAKDVDVLDERLVDRFYFQRRTDHRGWPPRQSLLDPDRRI